LQQVPCPISSVHLQSLALFFCSAFSASRSFLSLEGSREVPWRLEYTEPYGSRTIAESPGARFAADCNRLLSSGLSLISTERTPTPQRILAIASSPPSPLFSMLAIGAYSVLIAVFSWGLSLPDRRGIYRTHSLAGESRFGLENFARLLTGPTPLLLRAAGSSLSLSGLAALAAVILGFSVAASSPLWGSQRPNRESVSGPRLDDSWISALPHALSPA